MPKNIFQVIWIKILACLLLFGLVNSLSVEVGNIDSICAASKHVVQGEFNYYEGTKYGGTVGMFAQPYYWWHAGEAWGGILLYYTFCEPQNKTLKKLIYDGMYHQAGDDFNYIPSNQSMTEGNDDQGVWGMTIMEAVERNFTDPSHSWLSMVQAIYNTMAKRWDDADCSGGLRWQIFTWNSGYDYKNSIANGCLFHIAARLARYTRNDTYTKTAEMVWDWMGDFLFNEDDGELIIYDGAKIANNCSDITKTRWSYTYGVFMAGAAYMYNYTEDDEWLQRTEQVIDASGFFFNNSVMYEPSCSGKGATCNTDQTSFRSLFSRCLGLTAKMAPSTRDKIQNWLDASAPAAAQSCSGGEDDVTCGENWSFPGWDGVFGLGEQMAALEVMIASIMDEQPAPYDKDNGGSSKGDPNAGLDTHDTSNSNELKITSKDKAGAGVLTAVVLGTILGGSIWMAI